MRGRIDAACKPGHNHEPGFAKLARETLGDFDGGRRGIAGTDHGYHAQTFSWLTGELVRRVTGRGVGAWIADEIARPVGADL